MAARGGCALATSTPASERSFCLHRIAGSGMKSSPPTRIPVSGEACSTSSLLLCRTWPFRVLMYLALDVSYLLTLALVLPAAGFLVRTFVVFHDCAHGSLLPSKRANRYVGRCLGLFVLSPFQRWRHDHAIHHATSGDLERRGVGDIITLTVGEYRARPWRGRLAYRVIRNPVVMFGLGPVIAMMIGPRIATRSQRPRLRHSVLGTDAALLVVIGGLCWLIGWQSFLLVWAPSAMLAGSVGIWLFYVQHQFEDAYWQSAADWKLLGRGAPRQLLPEAAESAAVLHRQHRAPSRPPSERADSELQPSTCSRRERDLPPGPDAVVVGWVAQRPAQAVGRGARKACHVRTGKARAACRRAERRISRNCFPASGSALKAPSSPASKSPARGASPAARARVPLEACEPLDGPARCVRRSPFGHR